MKRFLLTISIVFGLVIPIGVVATVSAQSLFQGSKDAACSGIQLSANVQCDQSAGDKVSVVAKTALNLLSIVVGIAAVMMIIISGLRYVTSSGDSNNITGAKNALLYAIVGLVVTALAQLIVHFVLHKTVSTLPACPPNQSTLTGGGACTK
ncbi:MAG TPA: pilin [Candidatus Saccharimonadales bacterium]|nr:pilin [Candidatus Saccharimonadales bacterium]